MKNLSHHLIIVCICCCFCGLKAEETVHGGYSYRRYTTQDGLPQMLTECLYQDSHGFIWTGTLSGFARYDGITFETYLKGKEENIIRINENATGEVRGFAFRRSYTIDTGGDSLRVEQQSTGNLYLNHVNSRLLPSGYAIYEKGDGSDKALYLLSDTGLVERFRHTLLDELGDIRQLYWEPAARLFFIPTAKGIYEVGEGGGVVRLHEGISVYTFIIYSGQLWAAAADGLYRREGHSFERAYPYDFDYSFWGLNA